MTHSNDQLYAALLAAPQDRSAQALAARYAPILRFDTREPFLPLAAGYTIVQADTPSPSARHPIALSAPGRAGAITAIEYAIWWDWDIGHLYELEHVWVYLGERGQVIGCEASWHGDAQRIPLDGDRLRGDRVVLYSEPGKHAFAADPSWFAERPLAHARSFTRALAGADGVLAPAMFGDRIARTPLADTLARTFLSRRAFDPAWSFAREFAFEPAQLVPWPALARWIPDRVAWWIERLARELDPADYRPLVIAHRGQPAGGLGNTLAGLRRAAASGADLVGVDLHITADGVVVAAPAPYLRDGAGREWPIARTTMAELRALGHASGDAALVTLEQICAGCQEERVGLYAEIHAGRAIAATLAGLRAGGLADYAIVGAARPDWVAEAKALAPDIRAAVQLESPYVDGLALAQAAGADFVFPCWGACEEQPQAELDAGWVARAHAAGRGVIGWHSERPAVRAALQGLGLDAICGRRHLPGRAADPRTPGRLLAVCLDCGDTLVDEGTEIKDAGDATQRADLIPGAAELVRELARRGYPLALVADGPAATFTNVLTHHQLYDYFDAFAISGQLGSLKPERRNFVHALEQLEVSPADYNRTIMVGNNLSADVKGANAVGMISVWLDWAPRRAKSPADPTEVPRYTIREPLELLALIERLEQEL
jgi:HAD superfamily hydrolase (TIGR01549 family)